MCHSIAAVSFRKGRKNKRAPSSWSLGLLLSRPQITYNACLFRRNMRQFSICLKKPFLLEGACIYQMPYISFILHYHGAFYFRRLGKEAYLILLVCCLLLLRLQHTAFTCMLFGSLCWLLAAGLGNWPNRSNHPWTFLHGTAMLNLDCAVIREACVLL